MGARNQRCQGCTWHGPSTHLEPIDTGEGIRLIGPDRKSRIEAKIDIRKTREKGTHTMKRALETASALLLVLILLTIAASIIAVLGITFGL